MTEQTIESTMITEIYSVRPSTPVAAILELLTRHQISAVPVLDDDNRPLGVVSEEDILAAAAHPGPAPTAANLMNHPAITIHPSEPTSAAARRLRQEGIRQLLVVDQHGKLIGVLVRHDLLKPCAHPDVETGFRPELFAEGSHFSREAGGVLIGSPFGSLTPCFRFTWDAGQCRKSYLTPRSPLVVHR